MMLRRVLTLSARTAICRSTTQARTLSTHPFATPRTINDITPTVLINSIHHTHTGPFSQVHYDLSPDTIFAVSSGYGKCAVTIIRVSGTRSSSVVKTLTKDELPKARKASLRSLYDPKTGDLLDHSIVLWFPGEKSFSGEDSCEFHVHGGLAVVNSVVAALSRITGCRHAEAGEFTKRAFFNGKLDLTEVEGLGDLIHAETEAQRKQALRQLDGALSQLYQSWRETLVHCLAKVEAFIDFSEEENIEDDVINQVLAHIEVLIHSVMVHLQDNRRGERLRNGVRLAIVGEPNVGKSSVLNRLSQREAAIVSPVAGTTRDVVETSLDIGGYPVVVGDTAGLRSTNDPIEKEGVKRALNLAQHSDLKLLIIDAREILKIKTKLSVYVDEYLVRLGLPSEDVLPVFNKTDLLVDFSMPEFDMPCCFVSCRTEEGFTDFLQSLQRHVRDLCANPGDRNPSLTQARHRALLEQFLTSLEKFMDLRKLDIVLAAEELRQAQRYLGKVTGKVTTEEILDVIFRDFCIGK